MKPWIREWLRRNARFLAITLGVCGVLEVTFGMLEGTNHNFEFPWGHYHLTWGVLGSALLVVGYMLRPRSKKRVEDPPPARKSSK